MKHILLVGIGGFVGSVLRHLTYLWLDKKYEGLYPWSTFSVNMIGSLVLGILVGLMVKSNTVSSEVRLLLGVGLCGSFTTFSTFSMENMSMIQQKEVVTMLIYTVTSLVLGTLMAFGGYWLGKSI